MDTTLFSGIELSLDLGILITIVSFPFVYRRYKKEQKEKEVLKNIEIIYNELMQASTLIDDLFDAVMTWNAATKMQNDVFIKNSFQKVVEIHTTVWQFLRKLQLTVATKATPEMYKEIAIKIEEYKQAMENKENPNLGVYVLASLIGVIMSKLQKDEVVNDYIETRFGAKIDYINSEISKFIK